MFKNTFFLLCCLCCSISMVQAQSISHYEYWLDDDCSGKTSVTSSDTAIDINISLDNVTRGLHFFNFRAINDRGEVGNVYRTLFYFPEQDPVDMAGYEYWIDNDESHKVVTSANGAFISLEIDASQLAEGLHTFSLRARNSFGDWGPVFVEEFEVINAITAIEQMGRSASAERIDVYNLRGEKVLSNVLWSSVISLPRAIYIVNGRKIMVK